MTTGSTDDMDALLLAEGAALREARPDQPPVVDIAAEHITDAVRELDHALTHLTGRHANPSDNRRETLRKAATTARGLLVDALEGTPDADHE